MASGWQNACRAIWLSGGWSSSVDWRADWDAAGHRGAINAKGKAVAVFGTGADVIYPKRTRG
jgi:hypothetical protein